VASLAGTQIGKYDMIEEVGHGGMAVVYRGLDRVLKREVAVKVLHPHLADRKESRLRLEREAIAVAQLRHENILEIFDYSGPDAAESYIVTEFIHGVTLRDWVDDSLDPRPAVAALIVHRLCLALQIAHRGGIVHRDIKPENVMIREDGVLKLMDFGIAQIIDNQKRTLTGQLIGSPAYMAPELISGRPLDQRTDLFSLGILLYQLATGRLPFSGRNPHEVLNRIADGDYPLAATVCPLVDRDLEDIIGLALANDPDERYQSVETFGHELARYLEETGIEPTAAELGAYFKDPKDYVVELDIRICGTLTETAQICARDGETSRAIRLLGRVLEIDATHEGATVLLVRLRQRERRNRRIGIIAAAVATCGLVLGLVRYLPEIDTRNEGLTSTPSAASLERLDSGAGMVANNDASGTGPGAGVDPTPTTSHGTGPTEAAAEGTLSETDDAAETTEGSTAAVEPRPPPRKWPRVTPRVPVSTACHLSLSGIPLPTARNLDITVGAQAYGIEAMELDVEFLGTSAWVRVKDKRYIASHRVTREQCELGSVAVEIRTKPARIKFEGVDDDVVVVCLEGCGPKLTKRNINVRDFRKPTMKIPIDKGKLQQRVTLLLKHSSLEPQTIEKDLVPGPNVLRVVMVPK